MKVVLLAAGLATRMRDLSGRMPKGLIRVAGRELVYRTMRYLKDLGFNDFVVITVPAFKEAYEKFMKRNGFSGRVVLNDYPERGNGYSLYLAKDYVDGKFILIMSDHVYERDFIERAVCGEGLIVDRIGRFVDHAEATKVRIKDGRVVDIGKKLEVYDALDTGFFVLSDDIFRVASELVSRHESVELSEIMKEARVKVSEVSGFFWMDADTPEELSVLRKAIIKNSVKGVGDGVISRLINRRISTWVSEKVCEFITPDGMTWISFLIGMFSALVAYFSPLWGGVIYQLSSILDGVDGEIARASLRESKFGGWLDSLLDRFVDFFFLLALAYGLPSSYLHVIALAIFGSVMVSYSTERFKGAYGKDAYKEIEPLRYLSGKRDERIFLTMLFCAFGLLEELFWVLAVLTNIRVLLTICFVWRWNRENFSRR
ncbi:MAG: NTP transferase domain-containing protein [Synergistetes bacterium]|nr:NTP transferase domain-containing protein [Synergistota bacterium]